MRQRTIRRRQERAKKENQQRSHSSTLLFLSGLLLFSTLALYNPVRGHEFVNYDDDDYILKNPHVIDGQRARRFSTCFFSLPPFLSGRSWLGSWQLGRAEQRIFTCEPCDCLHATDFDEKVVHVISE
jgi:hypothetical protein